jgi:hypothetical protein
MRQVNRWSASVHALKLGASDFMTQRTACLGFFTISPTSFIALEVNRF